MNISFDVKNVHSPNKPDDIIKKEINYFKLHVEKDYRYISDFEIYPDDNSIMCYTEDNEIELTYKDNTITDIECYNQQKITQDLYNLIDEKKTISENLIMFNDYFYENDEANNETDSDEDSDASSEKPKQKEKKINMLEIFHGKKDDNESIISLEGLDDDDVNSDNGFLEDEPLKDSKPVKFEIDIEPEKLLPDLSDDIIIDNNHESDNYVPFEIIRKSKEIGRHSTVHQIISEINNAIKNTKNVIIKPIDTVFKVYVENKHGSNKFDYELIISERYPYEPPSINVKTACSASLTYSLTNCEMLNANKWNPLISLKDIIVGIYNNINKLDFEKIKSQIKNKNFQEMTTKLIEVTNTAPLNIQAYNLNFDFLKIQDKQNSKGIGYDFKGSTWDIKSHIAIQEAKNNVIKITLQYIHPLIKENSEYIGETCLIPYIKQYIYDVSLFEIEKNKEYYTILFKVFNEIYKLGKYNENFNLEKICSQRESFVDYCEIYQSIPILEKKQDVTTKTSYVDIMKETAFGFAKIIESRHFKFMDKTSSSNVSPNFSRRLKSEIRNLSSNLPISDTSSIFLRIDENNMSIMKFLIIPHPDTPYAYGCFEFDMYLNADYPSTPPHVEIITTGGGKFRFNPNLYDNGKVCLSLLGTWSGTGGESWSTESTILQVLLSIQSLIFCEEPYFNEPGYESSRGTKEGKAKNDAYMEPIRYNTLKLGMVEQLRNPSFGFEDIIKNHFKLKQKEIFKKLDDWKTISTNNPNFDLQYNLLKGLVAKL